MLHDEACMLQGYAEGKILGRFAAVLPAVLLLVHFKDRPGGDADFLIKRREALRGQVGGPEIAAAGADAWAVEHHLQTLRLELGTVAVHE